MAFICSSTGIFRARKAWEFEQNLYQPRPVLTAPFSLHLPRGQAMNTIINLPEQLNATARSFGDEPLLVSPEGEVISLANGYIPLHVNFTIEDKAAKGLRKRRAGDRIEPLVYFSALEVVSDNRVLLLAGPSGSGKTTFAKHLAFTLASAAATVHTIPYYCAVNGSEVFRTLLDESVPKLIESFQATNTNLLIILDTIDTLGNEGFFLLAEILTLVEPLKNCKLLLLGDSSIIKQWSLPPDVVRHDLRTLSDGQRREVVSSLTELAPSEITTGLGAAAAIPVCFALALEANHCGDNVEQLLDAWLAVVAPGKGASETLAAGAFSLVSSTSINSVSSLQVPHPVLFSSIAVQRLLAARRLVNLPRETSIDLFHRNPTDSEAIIQSLLARLDILDRLRLLQGLLCGSKAQMQIGALLVSDFVFGFPELQEQISSQMLTIVQECTLPIVQREKAGLVLSRLGDPRDLTRLAKIPAGEFVLGSEDHPNSQPPSIVSLDCFSIGIYPVVNEEYSLFVRETGRDWQSADGFEPETQNAPATDLTWYDAVAYCAWLSHRWQLSGRISQNEHVRLPSEPEWERAARGDQKSTNDRETIYPWGTEWKHDTANFEESGFNRRLSVGLFPIGRSPYGCYDMVGQVWEWCSTLWGEDMTTPSFRYPWHDDERESLHAPGSIRRVLRGGCFSSGRQKACCTYRGSLEPAGFWRGNGFRIVVASIRP